MLSALAAVMPRRRYPTAAPAAGYAAFMSYSHVADGRLAPRLQEAVEKAAQAPSRSSRNRSRTATTSRLWSSC